VFLKNPNFLKVYFSQSLAGEIAQHGVIFRTLRIASAVAVRELTTMGKSRREHSVCGSQ